MSLKYMGVPDRCPHGVYADPVHEGLACDKCEIARLTQRLAAAEALLREACEVWKESHRYSHETLLKLIPVSKVWYEKAKEVCDE